MSSVCTRRLRKKTDCRSKLGRLLHMHAAILAHLASTHRKNARMSSRYDAFKRVYTGNGSNRTTFDPTCDIMLNSFSYHNIVSHSNIFVKCAMCDNPIPSSGTLKNMIYVDTLKQPWIARCDACVV